MKDITTFINEALDEESYHVNLTLIANPDLHMAEKAAFDMCFDSKAILKLRNSFKSDVEVSPFGWNLKSTPYLEDLMYVLAQLDEENKFDAKGLTKALTPVCKVDLEVKENPNSDGFFAIRALKDGNLICTLITYIRIF